MVTRTAHRYAEVDGIRVFYRESLPYGDPAETPVVVLLHGFPSASHQYRRLIDALGARYRMIALDYPGFGHSDVPTPASAGGTFRYSFDRLADIVEEFLLQQGLTRFVLYVFDWGAPVGFRVAGRHPDWIAGLVVQNANASAEGLSDAARDFIALRRTDPGAAQAVLQLLTIDATRSQYETGAANVEVIDPDGWTLDQHHLDRPGRTQPQLDLAFDYESNLELYPHWQAWLRTHTPPTLIVWGRHDPFFTVRGAEAYLRNVPGAELHLLDTGHFALEERLPEIAPLVAGFVDRTWPTAVAGPAHPERTTAPAQGGAGSWRRQPLVVPGPQKRADRCRGQRGGDERDPLREQQGEHVADGGDPLGPLLGRGQFERAPPALIRCLARLMR